MPGGLISIHGAILLFGTAGLFGKFLSFDAVLIVLGRTLIAFLALVLVHRLMRVPVLLKEQKSWIWLAMTGGILAVHWIGFFRSIQVSSVAIGLLSFSSYPLFTTFLEPMFFPERLKRKNIFALIAVMGGLVLIATSGSSGPGFTDPGTGPPWTQLGNIRKFQFYCLDPAQPQACPASSSADRSLLAEWFCGFGSDSVSTEAPMAVQS